MTKPPITFMDGFDAWSGALWPGDAALRWTAAYPSGGLFLYRDARNGGGGQYVHATGGFQVWTPLQTNAPGVLCGLAFRPYAADPGQTPAILTLARADGTVALTLTLDDNYRLSLRRGGTTVLTDATARTTTAALSPTVWQYVELLVEASATVGNYRLRIDGTLVLEDWTGSQNTTGGVSVDRLGLGAGAHCRVDLDDLYLCDLTGHAGRDFYGDLTVRAIAAIAQGARSDWAAVGDPSKVADVARPGAGGLSVGTIDAATVGDEDLYVFDAGAVGGDPVAVSVIATARKTDTTSRSVGVVARAGSGGADVLLGTDALGASFTTSDRLQATDPTRGGAAWTRENLRDTQFGVKVAA